MSSSVHLEGAPDTHEQLLYAGFNQDAGCFACGTVDGFRIYNCEPFKETFKRVFGGGGIGIVEMLFRCNILALVGGGPNPRFLPNKVMIWDDQLGRCIGELSFRSDVRGVRLRRDRVVAVLDKKVYVYNFADLKVVDHIDTVPNPRGLCALCSHLDHNVLACPGRQRGQLRVDLYHLDKTTLIPAHESELMAIALNHDGTLVASASERGTLIRVFCTRTGQLRHEFRRGAERAIIHSISFNSAGTFVACTSDKGTVHVFRLDPGGQSAAHDRSSPAVHLDATPAAAAAAAAASRLTTATSAIPSSRTSGAGNGLATIGQPPAPPPPPPPLPPHAQQQKQQSSSLLSSPFAFVKDNVLKGILPKYFSSEWSFAQLRVPGSHAICAFGQQPNSLVVVCGDGSFFTADFDPINGGECISKCFSRFIATPPDAATGSAP